MKFRLTAAFAALFVLAFSSFALAQQVQVPRSSPRAEVAQTIGDVKVTVVYHRPSVKEREVWGKLVPYGQVWRAGANENTTFEVSENVKINGQDLPAGKYGLHMIPNKDEWTVIFSKDNDKWGSFSYKQEQDQLRVKAKPQTRPDVRETMLFVFSEVSPATAEFVLTWDKLRLPIMIDAGDVQGRTLAKLRQQIATADQTNKQAFTTARMTAANYVLDNKIKSAYTEAGSWVEESLKMNETFGVLRAKARLSAENGNFKDAVMYGEKAVTVGKAAQPAVNAELMANFEKDLAGWKTKK